MSPPSDAATGGEQSPVTFPINGHFSEEDIHELLGAMSNSHDHVEQHLTTAALEASHHQEVISMPPPHQNPGPSPSSQDLTMDTPTAVAAPSETASAEEVSQQSHDGGSGGCSTEETAISAEAIAQARSERKRCREKQRRSDVNKQFADLTALLRRIEAEDLEQSDGGSGSVGIIPTMIPTGGFASRVDLIARTIAVLERMHDMSCRKRKEVEDLNKQLEEMKKMAEDTAARLKEATAYQQGTPKPVMMMVPMMVNPGITSTQQPGAAAAPGFAMASPFVQTPQQPAMFMPQLGADAAAIAAPSTPATTVMPMTAAAAQIPQQQQMHAQQPIPQQQTQVVAGMPSFPQTMFASIAPPPPPAPVPQRALSPQQQQLGQKKQPADVNGGGGNLAHCA